MKSVKRPWLLAQKGPFSWPSHCHIIPPLVKALQSKLCHVEYMWIPYQRPTPTFLHKLQRDASSLIFLPSIEESMALLTKIRRQCRSEIPAVMVVTGQVARGSIPFSCHRNSLRSYDHFITPCLAEQKLAQEAFPEHHSQVHQIGFPIRPEIMFPSSSQEREQFRKNLGLKPHEKMVLYVGRLSLQKNLHGLLHVFAQAKKHMKGLKLFVVGGADHLGSPLLISAGPGKYTHFLCCWWTGSRWWRLFAPPRWTAGSGHGSNPLCLCEHTRCQ